MIRSDSEVALAHAAHAIGISWHRAYRLVLTGALEARFVAGRWLVKGASLDTYLKAQASGEARHLDAPAQLLRGDEREGESKSGRSN